MFNFTRNTLITAAICISTFVLLLSSGCILDSVEKQPPPPPSAYFDCSTSYGQAPLSVSFSNQSTGEIESYYWDFGDDDWSKMENPRHTYTEGGYYSVSLTVSGPGGTVTYTKNNCIQVEYAQLAELTDWRVETGPNSVTMYARFHITGYENTDFAMGGYWFRHIGDSYYYVRTDCNTNIPDNYLGHQWGIRVFLDNVSGEVSFEIPYSCFPERSGAYWGRIKLYQVPNIPIEPNAPTYDRTDYVGIYWNTTDSNNDSMVPEVGIMALGGEDLKAIDSLQCLYIDKEL